jgi:hypothetical protein
MSKEKCELKDDGFYNWCNGMNTRLNPEANVKAKGLAQVNLFNFSTGKESCLGVTYRRDKNDNGLMLNKCPWCGEEILNKSKIKPPEKSTQADSAESVS